MNSQATRGAAPATDGHVTTVTVERGRIYVRSHISMMDRCKSVPGHVWKKEASAWTYPPSPASAQGILDAFRGLKVRADPSFRALVAQAKVVREAGAAKVADNLPPIPRTKTKPWLHQLRAYHFAMPMNACMLALDMGCGKSKVVVDVVVNRNHKRVLILAPLSVIQEWPNQFHTHAAKPVVVYKPWEKPNARKSRRWHGMTEPEWEQKFAATGNNPLVVCPLDDRAGTVKEKVQAAQLAFLQADQCGGVPVIVANYETAWREPFADWAMSAGFDLAVGDELHRIQSANGKASKWMARLGDKVPWRLGLTGTPFSSGPLSIYGQYRFLDKGIYGSSNAEFKSRYARMGGYGNYQVVGFENEDELRSKFYSIAFRVESRDVLDLPDERHITRTCKLGPKAEQAYKELEANFIAKVLEGEISVTNALTKLLRLQQMTSGFARLDDTEDEEGKTIRIDSAKQELLADMLEDLDRGAPILVVCRFVHDLDAIKEVALAQKRSYAELSGRLKQTDYWRNGEADLLAVQINAGAEGVNLTRSHHSFQYSLGFSLAKYKQWLARTMRPGQKWDVSYYHLLADKTVDQKVYKALDSKQEVVTSILGDLR